jgi:2-phosphoglycerate kinase
MIYVIAGVAKAGKTFVSRRILKEKGISVFSTDYLMMTLAKGDPDHRLDPDDDDKLVAKALEPYLFGLIETMIENGFDQLIEGVHFLPAFAARLAAVFAGKIRFIFLGYRLADPGAKVKEILSHAKDMENAWFLSYPPKEMRKLVAYLIDESERIKLETEIYGLPYYEITDIVKDTDAIIERLFSVQ